MPSDNSPLSINERAFILAALKDGGQRIDGRRPFEYRKIRIELGSKPGTVEVQLGKTRALGVVRGELVEPYPDRPTEGSLQINVDFSSMASPSFEAHRKRPTEAAVELGRIVERGLREARAIDTEGLCVVAGKKVWSVRCDVHVLDHGGNMADCASLAALIALLHFRRPVVTVAGDTVKVHSVLDREPIPLMLHHHPVTVSFAFFDAGEEVVVDPNLQEELAMDSGITLTMNAAKELCAVHKNGGAAISPDKFMRCVKVATMKSAELLQVVQDTLKPDAYSRLDANRRGKRGRQPIEVPVEGLFARPPRVEPSDDEQDQPMADAKPAPPSPSGACKVTKELLTQRDAAMFDGSTNAWTDPPHEPTETDAPTALHSMDLDSPLPSQPTPPPLLTPTTTATTPAPLQPSPPATQLDQSPAPTPSPPPLTAAKSPPASSTASTPVSSRLPAASSAGREPDLGLAAALKKPKKTAKK